MLVNTGMVVKATKFLYLEDVSWPNWCLYQVSRAKNRIIAGSFLSLFRVFVFWVFVFWTPNRRAGWVCSFYSFHGQVNPIWHGFFLTVIYGGGGMRAPHHNFVVIALMIIKFDTGVKLDVFYTMATKNCDVTTITSLWHHNLYFSRCIGLNFRC